MPRRDSITARGTTLIELAIVLAVSSVLVLLIIQAMISFDRSRGPRQLVSQLQGEGRDGLSFLARDLQASAVSVPTGVVWANVGGSPARRPAVQIFNDVPGGGWIDDDNDHRYAVKPNTDALLVIRARAVTAGPDHYGAKLIGDHYQTQTLAVTTTSGFDGGPVIFGAYGDAAWDVAAPGTGHLTLQSSVNLFPSQFATKLDSGTFVRPALARLYYVDTSDELVQMTIAVPRAPASAADVVTRAEVVAQGIENLQIDCQVDDGTTLAACPVALEGTDPLAVESALTFGDFSAGQGPRITTLAVPTLRTIAVSVAVRSVKPVPDAQQGDPRVPLDGKLLGSDSSYYVRRTYLMQLGTRNLGLGVL